jgi:hypothetical protein
MLKLKSCLPFITVILLASQSIYAQGDLLLTPRRVVFDGTKKTQEVNLANTGKDTATYLVSMMEIRMLTDGSFEEIAQPDSGQNFASKYLRFFPRSVTLGPNEAQTIKIQLTKTSGLAPGEYRSHIYFRPVTHSKPLGEEVTPADSSTFSVRIVPVVGLTIPAIIRIGNYDAKVSVSDIQVDYMDDTPVAKMTLSRSGAMSVYGDVFVEHITSEGVVTPVGLIRGIAVYAPNTSRTLVLQLDKSRKYNSGTLRVVYRPQPDDRSAKAGVIFAEGTVRLK